MGTVPIGTVLLVMIAGREVHDGVRAPALGPLELVDLLIGRARDGRGAHVRIDLGLARTADRHRHQFVFEVHAVRGNNHPAGRDLVPDLLGRQVILTLRDPSRLGSDHTKSGVFQLGDRFEAVRCDAADEAALGSAVTGTPFGVVGNGLDSPSVGQEVPGGLVAGLRHPRRVGGGVGARTTDLGSVGEGARRRPDVLG